MLIKLLSALRVSSDYVLFGATKNSDSETDIEIGDFIDLLSSKSTCELKLLFEIVKLISKHKELF
jgi:hypothetical protein